MRGSVAVKQPQFEALANHWSRVKLITLWAVSWRQPGDIYRWTRVSNLAITAPLINSLSESLPGAQGFRDSDGLMMLVSCYSAALALYTLWFDTLQKDHNNCGSPLSMTTQAKRSLSVACPLKVFCLRWLGYCLFVIKVEVAVDFFVGRGGGAGYGAVLRIACLRELTVSSDQLHLCCSGKTIDTSPECKISARRRHFIIFCQTGSRKRLIQQVLSYISPPPLDLFLGQTWCILQGTWKARLRGKRRPRDMLFFFIWQPGNAAPLSRVFSLLRTIFFLNGAPFFTEPNEN